MMLRTVAAGALVIGAFFVIRSLLQRRRKNTPASKMFENLVRLPKFAVPRRYDLELRPDLDTCKFGGKLAVTLNVLEDTKYLVLNASDLVIADSSVRFRSTASGKVVNPSNVSIDAKDEILVLEFDETLPCEEGILDIEFQGTLNDQMKGFYRSTYVINGEKRNMAVTQFEPADARRCFPCWDEPSYKATFKITVCAPVDRVVLSNMPVFEEKSDGNLRRVSFQESRIMSTYLVAIVVGEFEYIERTTTAGNKVRVYCQVGKTNQGMFALDVAVRTLPYYAEYFGTPYPLPKLDMVAIPDFCFGAMENYGLVTYRETALLYDEQHSAAANKQRVVTVVTHELAHQWFGNLVTMEWWTHLWLNEGFATWVSYLAADYLFPEWKIWTQFNEETVDAFRLDALVESHPIEVEVGHARELNEIFDAISYKKGASIIRMLESYIGAQVFKKGLNSYIKRYAWKNAKTEDLWAVLSEVSREPVNELMDSWTKKRGYPVIFAKLEGTNLVLEQSQYLSSGKLGEGLWVIPITLCYGSYNARKNVLLRERLGSIILSEITHSKKDYVGPSDQSDQYSTMELKDAGSQPNWIKLNVGQTAFYRVQYDDELAKRLKTAIEAGLLDPPDRFGILDDMYALCSACKQPLSALLSLMDVYHRETDYSVLSCLIDIAYKVSSVVSDAIPQSAADFKSFTINLLHFVAENLGWEPIPGEGHLNAMLRGQILELLAQFGHEKTKVEVMRRFNAFLNDRSTALLPADIRKVAYIAVMQNATNSDKSGYESLLRIFRETDLSQEKVRILSSIASTPDSSIVREALDFSLSSEVRNQDVLFVLRGISREARETAWLWFKENWEFIFKNWGSGILTARFIAAVASPFSSEKKADEIQEFFSTRLQPSIERTVNQSIEQVRIRAQWVKHVQQQNGLVELQKELARRKH